MIIDTSEWNPQQAMKNNAGNLSAICVGQLLDGRYCLPVKWTPDSPPNYYGVQQSAKAFSKIYRQLKCPDVTDASLSYYLMLLGLAGF